MNEEWKAVCGYEGLYEVSNLGRVRSLDHIVEQMNNGVMTSRLYKGRILKIMVRPHGYCCVHLSNRHEAKWLSVHRLVALAFVHKPDGCDIVNHLDCDTTNNRADNLEWTTYSGNMQYASSLGHMKGNAQNLKKAQEQRKTAIIAKGKDGKIYEFNSQKEAAEALGVNRSHIACACRKEYGYKRLNGYEFFYKDPTGRKTTPQKTAMGKEERREKLRDRMLGNTYGKGRATTPKMIEALKARGRAVMQYNLDGTFVRRYASVNEVRTETGHNVEYALSKQKDHIAVGYIWRYANE